jgi:hypothetical protein
MYDYSYGCVNDSIQVCAHVPEQNQDVRGIQTIKDTIDELDGEIHQEWNDAVRHSFGDVSLENGSLSVQ